MSAIGPGDWVECVDSAHFDKEVDPLVAGAIYLVERLKAVNVPGGIIRKGLILRGVKSLPHAFRATRFRPIYRPKSDLIESLKTPAKREGVPA